MPQPRIRNSRTRPASSDPPRIERLLGRGRQRRAARGSATAAAPRPGGGQRRQRLGVGGAGELEVDLELLVAADHVGERGLGARGAERGALGLDALVDRVDPPLGLDHPLVVVADEARAAGRARPSPWRARPAARERAPSGRRRRRSGRRAGSRGGSRRAARAGSRSLASISASSLAGEAHRVLARLLGQPVHQRAALREDRPGDRGRVLGGEGVGADVDDAGVRIRGRPAPSGCHSASSASIEGSSPRVKKKSRGAARL